MSKEDTHLSVLNSLEGLISEVLLQPYTFRAISSHNVHLGVNSKWFIPDRILDDIHMLYVVSGEGTYVVEDRTIRLTQNHLLFLMNGTRHYAYRKQDTSFRIIPMRFRIYDPTEDKLIVSRIKPFHFCYCPGNRMLIQNLFETIHKYRQLPPSITKDALVHAVLSHALAAIHSDYESALNRHKIHPGIAKLKEYIDDRPTERSSLPQLAEVAGLSAHYCSKKFHQAYGMPLKEYQVMKRMEYAEYLLQHSNQSVKELALIIGYPDPYTFSKQFKKYRGYSPSSVTPAL
ncbi:AraC family transcriptional regulator [Paenibacillus doosanensis]|uniref:HTH-type transcriptional activator Btr n=1 Tax=Paenibacillus konkukensis TaxID=2020716 RepID=A0ABY4RVV6_9BACL|nr:MULTISPECIES: AraC family transcriptional regulator [Paenibacillus]MCS7460315.1 AraC family transcriptional regulator [Paenibacillus doosanensis]UQZ86138.1 HTH-type transcriptional activator Btr [Paenibacillus konkukensis]